jgi:NAD-dependent deacetylase
MNSRAMDSADPVSQPDAAVWRRELERVAEGMRSARSAVVLTGAGISVESGLGTFRGPGGLWEKVRVEDMATPEAWAARPGVVWRWYGDRWRAMRAAEPNSGHRALARWSQLFSPFLLVTQNIDGLHHRAGSTDVLEIHGGLSRARCDLCAARVDMDRALEMSSAADDAPRCACGGRWRPDVVWFGEQLPEGAFERAVEATRACQLFVSAGTSGTVYPAAGLLAIARQAGAITLEINPDPGSFSSLGVGLVGRSGDVLPWLSRTIEELRKAS